MSTAFHPLQTLLLTVAGWMNREQQRAIEYLLGEDRVAHCNNARPQQGLGSRSVTGRERLGGLLRHYRASA